MYTIIHTYAREHISKPTDRLANKQLDRKHTTKCTLQRGACQNSHNMNFSIILG